jgi:Phage tail tube protein, TTP
MSQQIPNGSRLEIASVMASPLTVTIATNASSCVLTVTNTYAAGDYVEFTSGWSKATNRVYRLSAATGTTATIEGLDTTSTSVYPAGAGIGTVRKVTTWVPVLQILDFATSGGDATTGTFKYLENKNETEFVTGVSAAAYTFNIADDISLAGYVAIKAVSDTEVQTAFRMTLPSGGIVASSVKAFVNQNPTLTPDQLVTVSARVSIQNGVQRY